jgi:glutamyl-tRNA synthetase
LTPEQISENLSQDKPFVVRLKVGNEKIAFEDAIRGKIEILTDQLGDLAICRGLDGALYNYSVVIDDHDMKITHVIRGEDHISNTPKQILLYRAFGWEPPIYAHLSLILGTDRTKLSKRHGATSVKEYLDQGYLPEALMNFLALLGWHPTGDREVFSAQELISNFSLDRVQKGGAIFNLVKLNWFNNYYLRKMPAAELRQAAAGYLISQGFLSAQGQTGYRYLAANTLFSNEYLDSVLSLVVERLSVLSELREAVKYFFEDPFPDPSMLVWKEMTKDETRDILKQVGQVLAAVESNDFSKESVVRVLEALYQGDKGRVLWPLRVALSGREASPSPFEIAAVLGQETVQRRINNAIQSLSR